MPGKLHVVHTSARHYSVFAADAVGLVDGEELARDTRLHVSTPRRGYTGVRSAADHRCRRSRRSRRVALIFGVAN